MWLRKTSGVPGAAPGGLEWLTLDDVVEVDDDLGLALLDIPGAGFVEAPAPAEPPGPTDASTDSADAAETPGTADNGSDPAEVAEAPSRRRTRKGTDGTVTE